MDRTVYRDAGKLDEPGGVQGAGEERGDWGRDDGA